MNHFLTEVTQTNCIIINNSSRGDRFRTDGLLLPKQALVPSELHPDYKYFIVHVPGVYIAKHPAYDSTKTRRYVTPPYDTTTPNHFTTRMFREHPLWHGCQRYPMPTVSWRPTLKAAVQQDSCKAHPALHLS